MIEIISGTYLLGSVISVLVLFYLIKKNSKEFGHEKQMAEMLMVSIVAFLFSWVGVFILWKQRKK